MINTLGLLLLYCIVLSTTGVFTDSKTDPVNVSFNAIRSVHAQLDDDHDGQIDKKESADYMQFELKALDTKRQLTFHNNDAQISVDELWKRWVENPAYTWTVDDVIHWLKMTVKLQKYEDIFRLKKVTGKNMPRLATSKTQYVQQELKITNAFDRKKIYLCAIDLILFGDADSVDVDKCIMNNGGCSKNAKCMNTIGSLTCTCLQGFIGNGNHCIDIDECITNNGGCNKNAKCMNTIGSYKCTCLKGFTGNGKHCIEEKTAETQQEVDKNFLAIKAIHSHLDDDRDGDIDVEESVEYIREELQGSNNKRHASFHSSDDLISVDDLWKSWQYSIVYNWTNTEVTAWLNDIVGLPQYEEVFRDKNVDGKSIPRLATDKSNFLQKELGILNATHRKKIYLRASDIILFGAPEVRRNYFSDTIVLVIMLLATLVVVYARHKQNVSKKEIEQLTSNMEHLQQAEQMLKELHENNEHSMMNGSNYDSREIQLRVEIDEAKKEAERLHLECSKFEEEKTKIQFLEKEVHELRVALAKAESELRYNEFRSPDALQSWLQLTYVKEIQHFHTKKQIALSQMQEAKEACEKVSKTRRTVLGSLRLAHGQSIDVVDQKILNAKSALADVTKDLQERQSRWQKIEHLCNFNIINDDINSNSGSHINISPKGVTDSVVFAAKSMEVSSAFHGITENEKLDYEVEAITRKGTLERSSTDTSCSQESIQLKAASSDQQTHSPPCCVETTSITFTQQSKNVSDQPSQISSRFLEKASIISNGHDETHCGVLHRNRDDSATSLNIENHHRSPSPNSEQSRAESPKIKRDALEKVYTRANTEPTSLNRRALENRANEKLKYGSQKQRPRPTSEINMGPSQKICMEPEVLIKEESGLERLRSNTRPLSEVDTGSSQKVNIEQKSLSRDESERESSNKVEFDVSLETEESDHDSLQVNSDDDIGYKSGHTLHTSDSTMSLTTATKKTPKGFRKLFHRKNHQREFKKD